GLHGLRASTERLARLVVARGGGGVVDRLKLGRGLRQAGSDGRDLGLVLRDRGERGDRGDREEERGEVTE
ncbi:MAG: hypothetical protein EOP67_33945, partial [Sphingomonas sp.]